jgi:hypothetical protein
MLVSFPRLDNDIIIVALRPFNVTNVVADFNACPRVDTSVVETNGVLILCC